MFEVEKKFILADEQKKRLTDGAEFLGEKTFTDVYYDTKEYALTKNDIWLRRRGDGFQLKLPVSMDNVPGFVNRYEEIEGEEKIRQIFNVSTRGGFLEDIQAFGYAAFCECRTARKKYKKEKFTIDLDEVDFGDFRYSLGEIEIMVADEKGIAAADEEILRFAASLGLKMENVRGKVIEYLARKKPEHYRALISAGVVIE